MTNENMIMEKKFQSNRTEEERAVDKSTVIPIRLNDEEWATLHEAKILLSQPKNSTAIKSLVEIGYFVIQRPEMKKVIETVFKNKQNNWRTGVNDTRML